MRSIVMLKKILICSFALMCIFSSQLSYAFELKGWWKSDRKDLGLEFIKITKERFLGFPYRVIEEDGDNIYISLDGDEKTKIEVQGNKNIIVYFPSNEVFRCTKITDNTDLSEEQVRNIPN